MPERRLSEEPPDEKPDRWDPDEALELWKYFGTVGAADKNTMVTVSSFLLGFSMALLGYVGDKLITFSPLEINDPFKGLLLALLGIVISLVSGYVSILYGGYSNWNWAYAEAIARHREEDYPKWGELLPENSNLMLQSTKYNPSHAWRVAMKLAKPCLPMKELALIFEIFTFFAVIAALLHLSILVLAGAKMKILFELSSIFVVIVLLIVFILGCKGHLFRSKVYFFVGLVLGIFEGFATYFRFGASLFAPTMVAAGITLLSSTGSLIAVIRRRRTARVGGNYW